MKKSIKVRLNMAMSSRGYSQSALSKKGGFDKGQLSSWLSGKYNPCNHNLSRLAEILSVDEAWLMGYDVPMVSKDMSKDLLYDITSDNQLIELLSKAQMMDSKSKSRLIKYAQLLIEEEEED